MHSQPSLLHEFFTRQGPDGEVLNGTLQLLGRAVQWRLSVDRFGRGRRLRKPLTPPPKFCWKSSCVNTSASAHCSLPTIPRTGANCSAIWPPSAPCSNRCCITARCSVTARTVGAPKPLQAPEEATLSFPLFAAGNALASSYTLLRSPKFPTLRTVTVGGEEAACRDSRKPISGINGYQLLSRRVDEVVSLLPPASQIAQFKI